MNLQESNNREEEVKVEEENKGKEEVQLKQEVEVEEQQEVEEEKKQQIMASSHQENQLNKYKLQININQGIMIKIINLPNFDLNLIQLRSLLKEEFQELNTDYKFFFKGQQIKRKQEVFYRVQNIVEQAEDKMLFIKLVENKIQSQNNQEDWSQSQQQQINNDELNQIQQDQNYQKFENQQDYNNEIQLTTSDNHESKTIINREEQKLPNDTNGPVDLSPEQLQDQQYTYISGIDDQEQIKEICQMLAGSAFLDGQDNKQIRINTANQLAEILNYNDLKTSKKSLFEYLQEGILLNYTTYQDNQTMLDIINTKFEDYIDENPDDLFLQNAPYDKQIIFKAALISSSQTMRSELNKIYSQYEPIPLTFPWYYSKNNKYLIYKNVDIFWSIQPSNLIISVPFGEKMKDQVGKTHLFNQIFELPFSSDQNQNPISRQSVHLYTYKSIQSSYKGELDFDKQSSWSFIDVSGKCRFIDYQEMCLISNNIIINCDLSELQTSSDKLIEFFHQMLGLRKQINSLTIFLFNAPKLKTPANAEKLQEIEKIKDKLNNYAKHIHFIPVPTQFHDIKKIITKARELISPCRFSYPEFITKYEEFDFTQLKLLNFCGSQIQSMYNLIQEMMEVIDRDSRDIDTGLFQQLPFYSQYIKREKLLEIKQVLGTQQLTEELNKDIGILQEHINQANVDLEKAEVQSILQTFVKIFSHEQRNVLLGELQERLKKYKVKQKQCQQFSNDKFSVEVLIRETLLANYYLQRQKNMNANQANERESMLQQIKKAFLQYVESGQPFEIIDGDNNYSLISFYHDILKEADFYQKKCGYVTILGKQSSGKSTVLKFTFGCHFQTSSGRCTRGVYGSIQHFNGQDDKYQYGLIIDTEGIDSDQRKEMLGAQYNQKILDSYNIDIKLVEDHFKRTQNFDILMSLFCMQVSQCLLLNIQGETMDSYMKDILILCVRGILIINNNHEKPELILTLNKLPHDALKEVDEQFNKIMEDIQKLDEMKELLIIEPQQNRTIKDILSFKKENKKILCQAFKTHTMIQKASFKSLKYDFALCKPEDLFGKDALELRTLVIKNLNNQNDFKPFSDWLSSCEDKWTILSNEKQILRATNRQEVLEETKILRYENEFFRAEQNYYKRIWVLNDQLANDKNKIEEQIESEKNIKPELIKRDALESIYDAIRKNIDIVFIECEILLDQDFKQFIEKETIKRQYLIQSAQQRMKSKIQIERQSFISKLDFIKLHANSQSYSQKALSSIRNELNILLQDRDINSIDGEQEFQKIYNRYFNNLQEELNNQKIKSQVEYLEEICTFISAQIHEYFDLTIKSSFLDSNKNLNLEKFFLQELGFIKKMISKNENIKFELDETYNQINKLLYFSPFSEESKYIEDANRNFVYLNVKQYYNIELVGEIDYTITEKIMNYIFQKKYVSIKNSGFTISIQRLLKFLIKKPLDKKNKLQKYYIELFMQVIHIFTEQQTFYNFLTVVLKILDEKPSPMNQLFTQTQVLEINREINRLEYELQAVGCSLTGQFKQKIFSLATLKFASYLENSAKEEVAKINKTMESEQFKLQQSFNSQLQNIKDFHLKSENGLIDIENSTKFVEQSLLKLLEKAKDKFLQQTIDKILNYQRQLQGHYTNKSTKSRFLLYLQTPEEKDQLFQYVTNPNKALKTEISIEIMDYMKSIIKTNKNEIQKEVLYVLTQMQEYFTEIMNNIMESKKKETCNPLGILSEDDIKIDNNLLQLFSNLLQKLLQNQMPKDHILQVNNTRFNIQNIYNHGVPQYIQQMKVESNYLSVIIDVLKQPDMSIFNLYQFLKKVIYYIIEEKANLQNQNFFENTLAVIEFNQAIDTQILKTIEEVYENARLCGAQCPGCGRGCDLAKSHIGSQHQCEEGHQLMAFQGWSDHQSNKATLTSCDLNQAKGSNNLYTINGNFVTWQAYASNYKNHWNFNSSNMNTADKLFKYQLWKNFWMADKGYMGKKICALYDIKYHKEFDSYGAR